MKKILVLVIGFAYLQLVAEWKNPELQSGMAESILQERLDEEVLWQNPPLENYKALSQFGKSIRSFFSRKSDNYFWTYIHENTWVKMSLLTGSDRAENYYFNYYGLHTEGRFTTNLYFYANWWKGHLSGYDDISDALSSPLIDSWFQISDDRKKIYLDNLQARMLLKTEYGKFAIGRETKAIGNNLGGSIILNDDCNEYGFFSANWEFSSLEISLLHATLIPDSTMGEPKKYNDKHFVTHQFSWDIIENLTFFGGEIIVYGNRNVDINYLLPISFYRIIEHNLADRDNVLIYGGLNFRFKNHLFYTNIILDELKKSEILGNWWGNKYAVQTGTSFFIEKQWLHRIGFEITAIRPWLYTHNVLENKYSHDGISLGFPEGSNLVQIAAEVEIPLRTNLQLISHFSYTVQGSLGNSFSINYNDRPKDTANWLEGSKTDTKKLFSTLDWQPLSHHHLKLSHTISKINNLKLESHYILGYQAKF